MMSHLFLLWPELQFKCCRQSRTYFVTHIMRTNDFKVGGIGLGHFHKPWYLKYQTLLSFFHDKLKYSSILCFKNSKVHVTILQFKCYQEDLKYQIVFLNNFKRSPWIQSYLVVVSKDQRYFINFIWLKILKIYFRREWLKHWFIYVHLRKLKKKKIHGFHKYLYVHLYYV